MKKNKNPFSVLYEKAASADIRFYILLMLLFSSLILMFTVYDGSLIRLISSIEDVITTLLYWFWFCFEIPFDKLFGIELPMPRATFMSFPQVSFEEMLSIDLVGLAARLERFKDAFGDLFYDYNVFLYDTLYYILLLCMMFGTSLLLFVFLLVRLMFIENGKPEGYISPAASAYMKLTKKVIKPVGSYLSGFVEYASEHKGLTYAIFFVWIINTNLLTFIGEIFSFFYYFICSFDLKAFFFLLGYIGLDACLSLLSLPLSVWIVALARFYYRVNEEQGLDKLQHMEAMNCGYLKTLDIIVLIVGEPGTGKTTLLVDMFLSWINIFKDENLKTIFKFELYFPSFPWAVFRRDLSDRIASRELKVLPNVEEYVDYLFDESFSDGFIYGYRSDLYRSTVDVGNREISLREALKEYGKAFALYTNENLGIANFPIRMDGNFDDSKFFKKWNGNFFEKQKVSRLTHILNQDMLRHGVKMDPSSQEIGAFGPSVIGWAEISKDLGNQNTNSQYKADALTCNPKNEKSTHSFMFARHAKTLVDNFPYIRIITDDQRAANVAASAVGLMCVVNIQKKSETMIAISGFDWYIELEEFVTKSFNKLSLKRENARGDITLSWLLIKQTVSFLSMPAQRMKAQFGYEELTLLRQAGNAFSGNEGAQNTAGQASEHVYYKMYWKNYSNRFISDSHASAYAEAQKRSCIGIDDIPCYQNLRMSPEEIEYQRSRLGSELIKMMCDNNSDDKN